MSKTALLCLIVAMCASGNYTPPLKQAPPKEANRPNPYQDQENARRAGQKLYERECSSCHGRSRVSYVDFTLRQLPFTVWTPWRRHSRLMRCPACDRRTWLAAHWLE